MLTRRSASLGLLAAPFVAGGRTRAEGAWPQRPVQIMIPFAPGGAADTLARILSEAFPAEANGHTLVVENRSGAGGTLAATAVANAAPDGHTILLGDIGANAVAGALFPRLPYNVSTAFKPVIHLANLPMVLIAHPSVGGGTLAGFLAAARAAPGSMNYASSGPGGAGHLMMELFNRLAGTEIVHIAYRGGGPVLQAVMTNEVQVSIATASTSKPFIEAGSVKALGVANLEPVLLLPNIIPIASEVPGFEGITWHGIHVPAATPAPLVSAINRTFNAILRKDEVRRRLETQQTASVVGGTPEAYGRFVAAEIEKWARVVRDSRIQIN